MSRLNYQTKRRIIMPKTGRPKRVFTPDEIKLVESLAGMGCTLDEIAGCLQCSLSTVKDRIDDEGSDFSTAYKRGKSDLKISLRRMQLRLAKKGNATMLIFFGKESFGATQ
jgi:hypothetical protein